MSEKVYPKPEDLGIGKHVVEVSPMPEFEEVDGKKKPIQGSHKHGESAKGFKWWLYSFKNKEGKYTSLFANEENKGLFDSGKVEVNVVQKVVNKEPVFTVVDGKPVPVLMHFVNMCPEQMVAKSGTPEAKQEVADQVREDINIEEMPF